MNGGRDKELPETSKLDVVLPSSLGCAYMEGFEVY
jgi:hypothetical protein